jgi:hypothetical protein
VSGVLLHVAVCGAEAVENQSEKENWSRRWMVFHGWLTLAARPDPPQRLAALGTPSHGV